MCEAVNDAVGKILKLVLEGPDEVPGHDHHTSSCT